MDLAVHFLSQRVLAEVAGSGDDDDTCLGQSFDLEADRIVRVRIDRSRAEAEINDLDVVGRAVVEDPLESVKQRGSAARAGVAEHLDADDIGLFRDTFVCTAIFGGIAGGLVGALGNGSTLPVIVIIAGFAGLAAAFLLVAHRKQPDTPMPPQPLPDALNQLG